MKSLFRIFLLLSFFCNSCSPQKPQEGSVKAAVDDVVSRFYQEFEKSQLDTIGNGFILKYLSEKEKEVLGTQYWVFEVNVPVTVSLMRDSEQETLPFWIEKAGFIKTGLEVKNSHSSYEVWQKEYPAGRINLGVNGFDKHRPVYFVSIAPQNQADKLEIKPVHPAQQHFETLETGAFTYHDWSGLTLTEVPEALKGQVLLTTIRGRAREAHLIGAFRETAFPASESPDQLLLTWSNDPKTSMDIQWRTDTTIKNGTVKYWAKGTSDTLSQTAERYLMEDRLLQNDRFVNRFTAKLTELQPGTQYGYLVRGDDRSVSEVHAFKTENSEPAPFSFIWTGDVHNSETWGEMMQQALAEHPESAFYIAAGDLVNTGLHRDDWDELMTFPGKTFANIPFMAVPGNHDSQDGLGAWMYQEMFSYPDNGPAKEMAELTYSFNHQNALFLMIDATLPVAEQTEWIARQLDSTEAEWKFAVFHFPPYNSIIDEWGPLFDRYHVDMVLSGHFHYYLRTKPIKNGEVMAGPAEGTLYLMSVGTTGKNKDLDPAPFAEIQFGAEHLYQHVEINGSNLRYTSYNLEGEAVDHFVIEN